MTGDTEEFPSWQEDAPGQLTLSIEIVGRHAEAGG
jgi:hypothetical protein